MDAMEPAQKRMKLRSDGLNILDLPYEVLEIIFLKLSQYDVQHNLALVCRRFLTITRQPIFVKIVTIEGDSVFDEDDEEPLFSEVALEKIEQVKNIYPNCNIELTCKIENEDDVDYSYFRRHHKDVLNYSWVKRLQPYDSSITKLTLGLRFNNDDDFSNLFFMENLESLDLDTSFSDQVYSTRSIQDVKAEFWDNFPNLKSLKIKSLYISNCPFAELIDKVCSRCRNLESFVYEGGYPDGKISDKNPKIPTKDEDKFTKLTHIKVAFDHMIKDHRLYNNEIEDDAILGNFKNYLTAKCPRLNKPIVIDQEEIGIGSVSLVFESKLLN